MAHHDLIIVGTGSGNSLVTPELEGLDIAIVEDGTFGGTCLNVGCIPTKMFVLPADRVVEAEETRRLGVAFDPPTIDWPAMRDRIFGRIDPIAQGGEDYRQSQDFVTVYRATARFVGDRRLALSTGEEISADRVVVAAGARATYLDVEGLQSADAERGVYTSDTVMRLASLPRRMVIIGGGFIAAEFAHVFDGLGVDVTVLQRSATLLRHEQRDVAERFTAAMQRRMDVRLGTRVVGAERTDGVWKINVDRPDGTDVVEAEAVLLAVGRRPNSDRLDCAAGGIDVDEAGFVQVDDQQRTTAPGVWALGDIASPWMLKHVANHEARVVAHNVAVDVGRLSAEPVQANHDHVPHAVFGHPQIAAFGPTAEQLEASGTAHVSAHQDFGGTAYGWALGDEESFLSVHADPGTGQILAAHCVGPQASTLIQPLIQAASFGTPAHEVARGQYWIHPALAEVVENALLQL